MAVISKSNYESLATYIGDSYSTLKNTAPYIASGLAEVVNLDDNDQEYDLLYAFYNANVSVNSASTAMSNYNSIVTALQTHVETRSGGTLAAYLTAQGITVSADFAEISKSVGWDIDDFIAP